jgi:NADP-dependent 3-hydroxy acid dehydrogenase YdfG
MADYAQAEAMVRRAERAFGGVDILVNVAGVMLPAPISEADPADRRRMVDVNLTVVLHAPRAALPGMIRRGNGHVMNMSSTSGRTHKTLSPVYAATKHGLGAFTEVLRKEVHPNRIRVTLFEPGPTEFLKAEDVAQEILWTLAQPGRINANEGLLRPTDQRDW